jgi:hypothetical protein
MRVQMASDNRRYASVGLPAVAVVMDMPGCKTPAETPDRVAPGTQAGRLVVPNRGAPDRRPRAVHLGYRTAQGVTMR